MPLKKKKPDRGCVALANVLWDYVPQLSPVRGSALGTSPRPATPEPYVRPQNPSPVSSPPKLLTLALGSTSQSYGSPRSALTDIHNGTSTAIDPEQVTTNVRETPSLQSLPVIEVRDGAMPNAISGDLKVPRTHCTLKAGLAKPKGPFKGSIIRRRSKSRQAGKFYLRTRVTPKRKVSNKLLSAVPKGHSIPDKSPEEELTTSWQIRLAEGTNFRKHAKVRTLTGEGGIKRKEDDTLAAPQASNLRLSSQSPIHLPKTILSKISEASEDISAVASAVDLRIRPAENHQPTESIEPDSDHANPRPERSSILQKLVKSKSLVNIKQKFSNDSGDDEIDNEAESGRKTPRFRLQHQEGTAGTRLALAPIATSKFFDQVGRTSIVSTDLSCLSDITPSVPETTVTTSVQPDLHRESVENGSPTVSVAMKRSIRHSQPSSGPEDASEKESSSSALALARPQLGLLTPPPSQKADAPKKKNPSPSRQQLSEWEIEYKFLFGSSESLPEIPSPQPAHQTPRSHGIQISGPVPGSSRHLSSGASLQTAILKRSRQLKGQVSNSGVVSSGVVPQTPNTHGSHQITGSASGSHMVSSGAAPQTPTTHGSHQVTAPATSSRVDSSGAVQKTSTPNFSRQLLASASGPRVLSSGAVQQTPTTSRSRQISGPVPGSFRVMESHTPGGSTMLNGTPITRPPAAYRSPYHRRTLAVSHVPSGASSRYSSSGGPTTPIRGTPRSSHSIHSRAEFAAIIRNQALPDPFSSVPGSPHRELREYLESEEH